MGKRNCKGKGRADQEAVEEPGRFLLVAEAWSGVLQPSFPTCNSLHLPKALPAPRNGRRG